MTTMKATSFFTIVLALILTSAVRGQNNSTESKRIIFSASLINIADPSQFLNDDFGAQLINLELPSPNGTSYRSFLMQQKIIEKAYWDANKTNA